MNTNSIFDEEKTSGSYNSVQYNEIDGNEFDIMKKIFQFIDYEKKGFIKCDNFSIANIPDEIHLHVSKVLSKCFEQKNIIKLKDFIS